MTGATHDLPPLPAGTTLPVSVHDALVDLAAACNTVGRVIRQAQLLAGDAVDLADAARTDRRGAAESAVAARRLDDAAVSYLERLTSVYALSATAYATYAVSVLADVSAGRAPASPAEGRVVRPSAVVAAASEFVPLIQPGDDRENEEVAAAHTHLVETIARLDGVVHEEFDDPGAAGNREPGTPDLPLAFPLALHRYAASLAWRLTAGVVGDAAAG